MQNNSELSNIGQRTICKCQNSVKDIFFQFNIFFTIVPTDVRHFCLREIQENVILVVPEFAFLCDFSEIQKFSKNSIAGFRRCVPLNSTAAKTFFYLN